MNRLTQLIVMFSIYSLCFSAQANSEDKEKHIQQLMDAAGISNSVKHMTDQVVQSLDSSSGTSVSDSIFMPSKFVERISLALENNYESAKFSQLIKVFSSARVQRMMHLEMQDSLPTDMQSFFEGLEKTPLSKNRVKLIRKLDALIGASQLGKEMSIAMLEAFSLAYAVDCPAEKAKIKKQLAASKSRYEKAAQGSTLSTFAFIYRDVSDKDLSDYIRVYKDKDVQWFQALVNSATLEEYLINIDDLEKVLSENIRAEKASQSMFTPKCGDTPDMLLETITIN